jgi:hypothetical protein
VLPKRDGLHQPLGLAISAGQQEHQGVVRKLSDFVLAGGRLDHVGQSRIRHQGVGANVQLARRRHQTGADVAERVEIAGERHRRRNAKLIGLDDVADARWMHVEHQHHRRARDELVGDLETNTDFHG